MKVGAVSLFFLMEWWDEWGGSGERIEKEERFFSNSGCGLAA